MTNPLFQFINFVVEKLLMIMMALIVITVTWQVFSRFILASPSSFTEELSRYLLIWIGILGAAYAYRTRAHLGLDLFIQKLTGKRKHYLLLAIEVLVIIFALSVMVYGGGKLVALTLSLNQTSAALGWKMGYVYAVIPFSGLLICLFACQNIFSLFSQKDIN